VHHANCWISRSGFWLHYSNNLVRWSRDTFVDFDRGLNRAINRIREALRDTASAPRFVETLPRRGYRFIASIEVSATPEPHTLFGRRSLRPIAAFFAPHFALSRDGSRLAFVAADSRGRKSLWVRDLCRRGATNAGYRRCTPPVLVPGRAENRVLREPKA